MSLKVSVIVPVFNPGNDIEDCIRTTLDQSLPSDEYEVIFVDDGSTDATPARLDRLAAEHDNVRVEHIPNSGWPGKPRNIGMDMARGEFVYFVDNDDWIGREALERLYARATGDDADVVVGKVVGHGSGKRVPRGIFRENKSGVEFGWMPLLWLLSPHKMFRKAMLDEHGIRFPEGRRRLEDHMFVVHAYFHAQGRISIMADYTCYHWVFRDAEINASVKPFEPVAYYGYLREVLDMVDEHAEPGSDVRDHIYLHYLRGKLLGRVGGKPFLRFDEDYRRSRYEEVHKLVVERFGEHLDEELPLNLRARAQLVRGGDYPGLVALAEKETALQPDVELEKLEQQGSELVVRMRAGLTDESGILSFDRSGDRMLWAPPEDVGGLAGEPIDVTDALERSQAYVFLERRRDRSDFALPAEQEVRYERAPDAPGRMRPVLRITARVSATTGAAGEPLPKGEWFVRAAPSFGGFKATGTMQDKKSSTPLILRVTQDHRLLTNRPSLRRRLAKRVPVAMKAYKKIRGRRIPRPE